MANYCTSIFYIRIEPSNRFGNLSLSTLYNSIGVITEVYCCNGYDVQVIDSLYSNFNYILRL
jgi:hypothetical protein